MRIFSLFILFFISIQSVSQSYHKAHHKAILVDAHNDILTTIATDNVNLDHDLKGKTHSDLARFREGGVDVQFFSVWCDGKMENPFQWALREIDSLYALVNRNQHRMMLAHNYKELKKGIKEKKLVAMIGVEGGHMIENDLGKLDSLYKLGARYLTLTWNNSIPWASSAMDETGKRKDSIQKGLSAFGRQVVSRMEELGMLVDLSHVGEQTFWDVMEMAKKPVIASHSCAHRLCPVFRNLKDDQIKAIAANGGVICLNFFSGFLDSNFFKRNDAFNKKHKAERDSVLKTVTDPYFADQYLFSKYPDEVKSLRPPLSLLLDHIDYLVKLAGIDHVGLGSDFDGVNSLPWELEGVEDFPKITRALRDRGYSKRDCRKILGGNMMRVMKGVFSK